MKIGCSCSPLQTHEDLVTEIALHLPLQSLFRCRALCKLWRDVIDSPFFRKLHTQSYKGKEDDDETVYLQFDNRDFDFGSDSVDVKVSITKLQDNNGNGKPLVLNLGGFLSPKSKRIVVDWFSVPVKGLMCFTRNMMALEKPMAICNPFLGQIRNLPSSPIIPSPIYPSCELIFRDLAIGCDEEFYKVVDLLYCDKHGLLHAHLYSKRTDSWKELEDQRLEIMKPIGLSCSDGHFAHWYVRWYGYHILTFDMKKEAFWTAKILNPAYSWSDISINDYQYWIVAKDDGDSFVLIALPNRRDELVRIYKSSISICEEEKGTTRKLSWNHVVNLDQPVVQTMPTPWPFWRRDCVIIEIFCWGDGMTMKRLFYDCRARRFIGCFNLPAYSVFIPCKGTFISP